MREFQIKNVEVCGVNRSILASGNPMRTVIREDEESIDEKDLKRVRVLGNAAAGSGHDNFLKGITVYMDVFAPLYMWKQIQRYHWFDFISSQSTMHSLLKFSANIEDHFTEETDPVIINRYKELIEDYNNEPSTEKWRGLVASLPSGFILGATMVTNYLQLKTMYFQRRGHKLKEWKEFCRCCEELPMFKELVLTPRKAN